MKTKHKILIARGLKRSLVFLNKCVGKPSVQEVRRKGIRWQLDLNEGIDLAIYIFGEFESGTAACLRRMVKPGFVVLDIGANIGAHVLPLAGLVGDGGRVIGFEPTDFAFKKASGNISLNPELAPRITLEQMMLTDNGSSQLPDKIHSSWPLEDQPELDELHRGALKSTAGARAVAVDQYLEENGIKRVDLVKLDVDGFEVRVLRGAKRLLKEHHPSIVLELAPHTFTHPGETFEDFIGILKDNGYRLFDERSDAEIALDASRLRKKIVHGGGINAVAKSS